MKRDNEILIEKAEKFEERAHESERELLKRDKEIELLQHWQSENKSEAACVQLSHKVFYLFLLIISSSKALERLIMVDESKKMALCKLNVAPPDTSALNARSVLSKSLENSSKLFEALKIEQQAKMERARQLMVLEQHSALPLFSDLLKKVLLRLLTFPRIHRIDIRAWRGRRSSCAPSIHLRATLLLLRPPLMKAQNPGRPGKLYVIKYSNFPYL